MVENGNLEFIKDVTSWIIQEKSVYKVENPRHHHRNDTVQHGIYRIKDELVFFLTY